MRICSVTLHNRTDDLALDALRSVLPFVDCCLILDTHPEPGYPFTLEREVCGDKWAIVKIPPLRGPRDAAPSRNRCLQVATGLGFDWAIILDTDERFTVRPGALPLREQLAITGAEWLRVYEGRGVYPKDKVFRLPARGQWVYDVHECYHGATTNWERAAGLVFAELPRTPEQAHARLVMIRDELRKVLAEAPPDSAQNARNKYYLADALESLGEFNEAVGLFVQVGNESNWDEEAAWGYTRAAMCLGGHKRFDEAFGLALLAHGQRPDFPDVACLLGQICLDRQEWDRAIDWASISLRFSPRACNSMERRSIFCAPPFVWEGPYQVLADAWKAKGDAKRAEDYARKAVEVERQRMALEVIA